MVRHIVMWKLTGDAAQRAAAIQVFEKNTVYLSSIIPQVRHAEIGVNTNTGDVFHVCYDSVFDSMEDLQTYINHPEHLQARDFYSSVSYDKVVFDYEF